MISGKNKIFTTVAIQLLLGLLCCPAMAQPSKELAAWQLKYPRRPVITSEKKLDIIISMVDNQPVTTLEYYKELVILTDNSAVLADSREYFSSHYKLNKLEAYSLVPEKNQYRKIPVSSFIKTVDIDGSIYYDDQYAYGFTFPAVGKGTKLVTKTSATTKYAYLPVLFDFGGSMPGERMVVTLTCPANVRINYHLFGLDTTIIAFEQSRKGDRIIYRWQADNPKGYDRDEEAPDYRYFVPHLVVQIAGYTVDNNFKAVIGSLKDLYALNYSMISSLTDEASPDIRFLTDSIVQNITDDREKVRHIFRWVQKNIRYVAIEDGDNGFVPREASVVFKRRYGDCKDKTSLLVAMIRSQDMRASFAWIGSRDLPYRITTFPSMMGINHMIAVWWDGDKPVILDGTTYSHSMEDIPVFIQGKECLIEKGKDDYMIFTVPVAQPKANMIYDSLVIRLVGDTVVGKGFVICTGEQKARLLAMFEGKDTASYSGILLRQLPKASNKLKINAVKIADLDNDSGPFTITYDFSLPDYVIRNTRSSYINLYLIRSLQQLIIREDRWMPFETEMTLEHVYICNLQIPDGFQIRQLPENSAYNNPEFSFTEDYSGDRCSVRLASQVIINFQIVHGNQMDRLREMLSLMNKNYMKSLPLEKI